MSRTVGSCRFLLTATVLAACSVEPPPATDAPLDMDVPSRWTTAPEPAAEEAASAWWTGFEDPRLDELVALALAGNRDLRASLARIDAAAADQTLAAAAGLPLVDASFDPQRSRRLFLGFPFGGGGVPSSTTTTYGLSVNLRWEIDLWGRIRAGESAAVADLQAVAADHAGAVTSLTAGVCRAYFAAVEARQQLALAEATVAAFGATTEDVRDRYRRGVRPALDVHLAGTNLANAEALVTVRRDALQRSLRQIDLLVGRYPRGEARSADLLPDRLPPVPAGLPSDLLQRRPDLVAAERRLAAAGCRVDAAKAALYPRLSLTGSAGTSSTDLEDLVDDDFRFWSIAANLLQPIFAGGALRAEVARTLAVQAEALANYGGTVLQAFAEVENALASESLLAERRTILRRAALHAQQAQDLARQRWQLGLTDFLAVADGQRQAYRANAELIALEREMLDNRIDLYLALGGGFTADQGNTAPQGKEP